MIYVSGSDDVLKGGSIICTRPALDSRGTGPCDNFYDFYDNRKLPSVIKTLLKFGNGTEGAKYDTADLLRQMLSNYALEVYHSAMEAFKKKDTEEFVSNKDHFMELMHDLDALLDIRPDWRMQKWIDDARSFGTTEEEKALYEYNARMQVTIWGNEEKSVLFDYSWKEWSGLIDDYYAVRWQKFFDMLEKDPEYNEDACEIFENRIVWDANDFRRELAKWESEWEHSTKLLSHGSFYDGIVEELLEKYCKVI